MAGQLRSRTPKIRWGTAAVALSVFAGACASGGETDVASESPATAAAASEAPTTAPAGKALPALAASNTLDGGQIDWASLEGQDVVLWFWAPW